MASGVPTADTVTPLPVIQQVLLFGLAPRLLTALGTKRAPPSVVCIGIREILPEGRVGSIELSLAIICYYH